MSLFRWTAFLHVPSFIEMVAWFPELLFICCPFSLSIPPPPMFIHSIGMCFGDSKLIHSHHMYLKCCDSNTLSLCHCWLIWSMNWAVPERKKATQINAQIGFVAERQRKRDDNNEIKHSFPPTWINFFLFGRGRVCAFITTYTVHTHNKASYMRCFHGFTLKHPKFHRFLLFSIKSYL